MPPAKQRCAWIRPPCRKSEARTETPTVANRPGPRLGHTRGRRTLSLPTKKTRGGRRIEAHAARSACTCRVPLVHRHATCREPGCPLAANVPSVINSTIAIIHDRRLRTASPRTAHRTGTAARGRRQRCAKAPWQGQTSTHLQKVRYGPRCNSRRRMESLSMCLFLHRRKSSPSEQRWHRRHASPFWQPPSFQNHAQGRQSPVPCMPEPAETAEDIPAAPSGGETPPSSLPSGIDCPPRPWPTAGLRGKMVRSVAARSFLRVLISLCGHR